MGNPWEWDVLPAKGADNEELERAMRTEMTLEDVRCDSPSRWGHGA